MDDKSIKLFENKRIRSVWDEEKQEWYLSVVDVCAVLTDSDYQTARKYWKNLKSRMLKEGASFQLVTNCYQLKMQAHDGKMRDTDVANAEEILRLIQSIPSPKAEPFKVWLTQSPQLHQQVETRALPSHSRRGSAPPPRSLYSFSISSRDRKVLAPRGKTLAVVPIDQGRLFDEN